MTTEKAMNDGQKKKWGEGTERDGNAVNIHSFLHSFQALTNHIISGPQQHARRLARDATMGKK